MIARIQLAAQLRIVLAVMSVFLTTQLEASPTANAGADIQIAPDVPVILDGSGSADSGGSSLSYLWTQTAGSPLDIIGRDRIGAMVVSARQPGIYAFSLTVSNATESATDQMLLTVAGPSNNVIYVDNIVSATITDGKYSILQRDASGTDGNCYKTLQEAADVVEPGMIVRVRGGSYLNTFISNQVYLEILHVTTSGTAIAPIRFEAYDEESVILSGFGYEDRDLDLDGYADGPMYSPKRETLVLIEGNYVQIVGFELQNSQGSALVVRRNFCYVEECVASDNWLNAFVLESKNEAGAMGSVFRWNEAFRTRHGSGGFLGMNNSHPGYLTYTGFLDCLFYNNGFQQDGSKVLPLPSDPAGGGNSDGVAAAKYFSDAASAIPEVDNFGPNNFLIRNICYHNADDGIDTSIADSLIEDNLSISNGPEGRKGFKMLRPVRGMAYRGNLAYSNDGVGFELRATEGEKLTVLHNSSLGNVRQGILGGNAIATYRNNLCAYNEMNDFVPTAGSAIFNCWSEDGTNVATEFSGDPQLVNPSLVFNIPPFDGSDVRARRDNLAAEIAVALRPMAESPLVDAGSVIAGYHCATADDDPLNPSDPKAPGRHWVGAAPDLGAFEFIPPRSPAAPKNLRVE
jgi:hypothetical protein